MPADNIKRAIQRGTGELPGVSYEEITYEGYGPGGAAVIIETLTDNKNRTVGEIRHTLGEVRRQPRRREQRRLDVRQEGLHRRRQGQGDEDDADGRGHRRRRRRHAGRRRSWEIVSAPDAFQKVLDAVKALGIEPGAAEIAMLPQNYVKLEGKPAQQMVKLMEALEEHEDTQEGLVERRHRREGDRGLVGVKIFGIDPGSERTGYGCIETDGSRHRLVICGSLSAPARSTFPDKLKHIHAGLAALLARHRPDCVAVENIFYARNVRSALKLGHARGVALLAASRGRPAGRPSTRRPRSSARSSASAAPRSTRCSR